MKILALGDVVGRSGRDAITTNLPKIIKKHEIDFTILNAENAAGGFGVLPKHCEDFFKCGVDVITTGNHIWDQEEIIPYLQKNNRILRPLNFPENQAGKGYGIYQKGDKKILVIHALGQLFMPQLVNDPFAAIAAILKENPISGLAAIVIDFHAEATSEKQAIAHHFAGKVSFVFGTHTHVPTADNMILRGGTAYQTDLGMCGDYDSILGFETDIPISNFVNKRRMGKMKAASGEATLCGAIVEIDSMGKATNIQAIKFGGKIGEKV